MEQAKKHDKKIFITDIVISKVPYISLKGFTETENTFLWQVHKNLLAFAQKYNESNEVAAVYNIFDRQPVYIKGTENKVAFGNNIDYSRLRADAYANEIVVVHNHPSTSNFSLADIDAFLGDDYIGVMSVVTNQGEIYLLQKLAKYDYNKARRLLTEIAAKYTLEQQDKIAEEFLYKCSEGGVAYVKGK